MTPVFLLVLLWQTSAGPQQTAPTQPHVAVETIGARSEDVATIDGIVKAFYDVISGPAGQPRQWSRDRTLYRPDVRFVALGVRDSSPVV